MRTALLTAALLLATPAFAQSGSNSGGTGQAGTSTTGSGTDGSLPDGSSKNDTSRPSGAMKQMPPGSTTISKDPSGMGSMSKDKPPTGINPDRDHFNSDGTPKAKPNAMDPK